MNSETVNIASKVESVNLFAVKQLLSHEVTFLGRKQLGGLKLGSSKEKDTDNRR
jgi:hypothetical protein